MSGGQIFAAILSGFDGRLNYQVIDVTISQ
jgi:hypothetical protein